MMTRGPRKLRRMVDRLGNVTVVRDLPSLKRVFEGAPIAFAKAARSAGMKPAMLSNSFGLDPYDPYAHIGVMDLFGVTVISEIEGIAKPDSVIYQTTLDRMGLSGPQCVFVDDHLGNLPPAAALGIHTVHATSEDNTVASLESLLGVRSDCPA
ncbi:HAD-IA family hydrolase [Streptomyces sp. NPDC054765]